MSSKSNSDLCVNKCASACCVGLSIPTNSPKTKEEREELRFYVIHERVEVYIRNKRWYILINEKCMNLNRKNLCMEYETRPSICRDFSNAECEYWGDYYDEKFTTDKELVAYFDKKKKKPKLRTGKKRSLSVKRKDLGSARK